MDVYGYCRISTKQQSIDRQVRNIKDCYADATIVKEVYSGTTQDRPEWKKLYKKVINGDSIVFDSVSRMSRNAEEGYTLYKELYDTYIQAGYKPSQIEPLLVEVDYQTTFYNDRYLSFIIKKYESARYKQ